MTPKVDDRKIREALKASGGIVTVAADILGITKQTIYSHFDADPELKAYRDSVYEEMGDYAEAGLLKLVKEGKFDAIKFALSTKFKNRGYTEKQEIDINATETTRIIVDSEFEGLL